MTFARAWTGAMAVPAAASNEELLTAVASGDRGAFRQLYDATSARLFPICLKMLRDRDAAKDVFQDAFFRIWQKAYLFDRSKGSALAWMATITRRCTLARLSETARRTVSIDDLDVEQVANAASLLGGTLESVMLRQCLKQLDAKYSEVILLAYFYGLTHEELAANLNIPLGTAKSRLSRGLAQLYKLMTYQETGTQARADMAPVPFASRSALPKRATKTFSINSLSKSTDDGVRVP